MDPADSPTDLLTDQPAGLPHLSLGVCDYPEHVSRDRWESYAADQKALGLDYVRIGEFAWSRLEPSEGNFQWTWLDEAIEVLAQADLKVVLCTPTASPPPWLVQKHPEILPTDSQGRVRRGGSRRHYDFASEIYREHSRRITAQLVQRYGEHPAVAGWQTDNEFGCHDTTLSYGPDRERGFRTWLQDRYQTLQSLNEGWGTVFWGQEYSQWSEIGLPNLTVTDPLPAQLLDFRRHASHLIETFQQAQIDLIRAHSPGRFVTHNFMGFFGDFDHYQVAKSLDFVSWDAYPTGLVQGGWTADHEQVRKFARVGHPDLMGFNHDLYRGLKKKPFWVMEQQCGQINWAAHNPLPADGAVQLWTAQAWGHGADTVSYFRWRAASQGQEVLHSGLLRHDEAPDRGHEEVRHLQTQDFELAPVASQVALLHDYESLWLYDQQKHHADLSYWGQMLLYYSTLRSQGIDVDIVHPDTDLSGYRVVVAPALVLMTPERARHLAKVSQNALLVFGPRTATRTATGQIPEGGQFGPLTSLVGGTLRNFDALLPGMKETVGHYEVSQWAESYHPTDAEVLHVYETGPLAGGCAVMRRNNVLTVGAWSPGLVYDVMRQVLAEGGVPSLDVPEGIRISRRAGRMLVQNFNPYGVDFMGTRMPAVSFDAMEGPG